LSLSARVPPTRSDKHEQPAGNLTSDRTSHLRGFRYEKVNSTLRVTVIYFFFIAVHFDRVPRPWTNYYLARVSENSFQIDTGSFYIFLFFLRVIGTVQRTRWLHPRANIVHIVVLFYAYAYTNIRAHMFAKMTNKHFRRKIQRRALWGLERNVKRYFKYIARFPVAAVRITDSSRSRFYSYLFNKSNVYFAIFTSSRHTERPVFVSFPTCLIESRNSDGDGRGALISRH